MQLVGAIFFRDSSGNEVDLVLEKGVKKIVIEIKSSTSPKLEKVKFLKPDEMWVVAQVDSLYPGPNGVKITNLESFLRDGPFKD